MCGIFAITGNNNQAGDRVFEGLGELEYRGYDSWGIAERLGLDVVVSKEVGKISQGSYQSKDSCESMGHSRWATHGKVTVTNAHPHHVGLVTVVHNGIIENYLELKEGLIAKGYQFASQTDTEVLCALIDDLYRQHQDMKEALRALYGFLKGRYAFVCMISGVDGLWAMREGSPLIVGVQDNETYLASDIPAFLVHTDTVNYVDDGQMVYAHKGQRDYFDALSGDNIEKRDIRVEYQKEAVDKGSFEYYMIKEIFDQKETIARSLDHHVSDLDSARDMIKGAEEVYLVACGTAHKMAMVGQYLFQELAGIKTEVVCASEMDLWSSRLGEGGVVIAISQSGETADVLEVTEQAVKQGARLIAITNVVSSSLGRSAEVVLPISAGIEKSVASTKAATGMLGVLYRISSHLGSNKACMGELLSVVADLNNQLNPRYRDRVQEIAQHVALQDHLYIIGRGSLHPIALESAIKIAEVSYIHAQGFPAGELKHGPIALVEEGTVCLVLGQDTETMSSAEELRSRGAIIVGISPQRQELFDYWLECPTSHLALPIAVLVPVQLLAYELAIARGLDPDMPRNLAKSVTVK